MIYIEVEGGLVSCVSSDDPREIGTEVTIVDYDTETADPHELGTVTYKSGKPDQAFVRLEDVHKTEIVTTEPPHFFMLSYRHCGTEWTQEHSAACNDRCPKCNREIEPFEVEDA